MQGGPGPYDISIVKTTVIKSKMISQGRLGWFHQGDRVLVSTATASGVLAKGEQVFRKILITASNHNIPLGFRRNFIPGLPSTAIPLINQRDNLRKQNPSDPHITRLNSEIEVAIRVSSRQKWIDKLSDSTLKNNPTKFWSLLKSLSGKNVRPPRNQPIAFKDKALTKAKSISRAFCKQYTSAIPHTSNPKTRKVLRRVRKNHPLDTDLVSFTTANVDIAIRVSKSSSAVGPDGLTLQTPWPS
jgi:hypothetical protein